MAVEETGGRIVVVGPEPSVVSVDIGGGDLAEFVAVYQQVRILQTLHDAGVVDPASGIIDGFFDASAAHAVESLRMGSFLILGIGFLIEGIGQEPVGSAVEIRRIDVNFIIQGQVAAPDRLIGF